jgi:hypothetical protein
MAEAWMVRGSQRQRLIEGLVSLIRDWAEEFADGEEESVILGYLIARLHYLLAAKQTRKLTWKAFVERVSTTPASHQERLIARVVVSINQFARADEEALIVLSQVLKGVAGVLENDAHRELGRVEHEDPQKIFHAPSAMSEIPFPQDDEEDGHEGTAIIQPS